MEIYEAATEAAAATRAAGRWSQAAADAALAREAAGRQVASLQQQYRRLWLALAAAGAYVTVTRAYNTVSCMVI